MLTWLLNRIQSKKHDENRGYAAELISILLQDNVENRLELGKKDGVETILKVLSVSYYFPPFVLCHTHQRIIAIPAKRSCPRRRDRVYGKLI